MIVCPNCRTQNRDGAKRCKQCGSVLPQPPMGTPGYPQQPPAYPQPGYGQPIPPPPPPPVAAEPSLLRRIPCLSISIGCLLLLIGFLLGIVALWGFQTFIPFASSNPTPTPITVVVTPTTPAAATATSTPVAVAPTPSTPVAGAPTASPTLQRPNLVGVKAPTISLKNLDDQNQDLSALIANKFVVIVFWTTDTKNDDAMAVLQKNAVEKSDRFVAIAINPRDNRGIVKNYAQDKHLDKITLLIDEGAAKNVYAVTNMPTYFLIGKDGVIIKRLEAISKQDLENEINALVR